MDVANLVSQSEPLLHAPDIGVCGDICRGFMPPDNHLVKLGLNLELPGLWLTLALEVDDFRFLWAMGPGVFYLWGYGRNDASIPLWQLYRLSIQLPASEVGGLLAVFLGVYISVLAQHEPGKE